MIAKMNRGPEWCRNNRQEILAHLQSAYDSASLLTKGIAYVNAKRLGYPLTLGELIDLAIDRAMAAESLAHDS